MGSKCPVYVPASCLEGSKECFPDEDAVEADKRASLSAQAVDTGVPCIIKLWLALTTKLWDNISSLNAPAEK